MKLSSSMAFVLGLLLLATSAQAENTIPNLTARLKGFFPNGRHDIQAVNAGDTVSMIQQYLVKKLGAEEAARYQIVNNPPEGFPVDQPIAGTVGAYTAVYKIRQMVKARGGTYMQMRTAGAVTATLNNLGAGYGYDGFEQNGCAAPTPFLLIVDPKNLTVSGIDLDPCQES